MTKDRHSRIKQVLWAVLMILLMLPAVYQLGGLPQLRPLEGHFETAEPVEFSLSKWFSGEFQETAEPHVKENIGLRSLMVRTYNQWQYSLYNHSTAKKVLSGQEGYLYEQDYIEAYYGRDFIGEDKVKSKVLKLESLHRKLKEKDIELLLIFAPSKASFYPEYLLKEEQSSPSRSNIDAYREQLKSSDVPLLDLNQWFINAKDSSRYPLMPKTGVHWSVYGERLAFDSISRYLSSRGLDMPDMHLGAIEASDSIALTDDDIETGMNLLFDIPDLPMAYPEMVIAETASAKPKALVVGDSFFNGLFLEGVLDRSFGGGEFWYYNELLYRDSSFEGQQVLDSLDRGARLADVDVVIILFSESNLKDLGYGFIEDMEIALMSAEDKQHYQDRVEHYIQAISSSGEWLAKVKLQAEDKGISIEACVLENAKYMVRNE